MDPPPPPSYEEVMLGRPIEASEINFPPLGTYNTMHDYVHASAENSASALQLPLHTNSVTPSYWNYHGLEQLASLSQVCVSNRKKDSYHVTDTMKTILYKAELEMETSCLCCQVEKGPGITFHLVSSSEQKILVAHRAKLEICCTTPEETITVTRVPDASIGTIEGCGQKYSLKNASGDTLCSMEKQDTECCYCGQITYQVVPSSMPNDKGSLELQDDGCTIIFPSASDVFTKALLICTTINISLQLRVHAQRMLVRRHLFSRTGKPAFSVQTP